MAEHTDSAHQTDGQVTPADVDWEARYQADESLWSGHVNGSLAAEVRGIAPGTALDVGCGEGADAIWLAEHGWTVTGVDISATAVERGRAEATDRGLSIDWRSQDLLERPLEDRFDLVSLHYPAFDIGRLDDVAEVLTAAVAENGVMLLVGHAPPDDPSSIPFDPADWVQPADIAATLDDQWEVELHETRPRPGDHHHDSPHSHDVIVRARRRP
ncbi:MAG: class I SAM-dependent methyltransferase [Actinomycetota bacterium]